MVPLLVTELEVCNVRRPPDWMSTEPPATVKFEPGCIVSEPPFATVRLPPDCTVMLAPLMTLPPPASVSWPPDWMKIEQPLQPRFNPVIGLGMMLLTMSIVGDAFVSAAVSPGAQP